MDTQVKSSRFFKRRLRDARSNGAIPIRALKGRESHSDTTRRLNSLLCECFVLFEPRPNKFLH